MKHTALTLAVLLSLFSVSVAGAAGTSDLVSTAVEDGRFEMLTAALQQAGLVDALRGEGPFTVFAPTDAAFAALPAGALKALLAPERRDALAGLLTYHVVSGHVQSKDLLSTSSAQTLSGKSLPFGLRVGKANVIEADILCSNGVIHVIDRVLVPGLEVRSPKTVSSVSSKKPAPATQAPPMDVSKRIVAAIDRGVPLFNAGHEEQCAHVYAETARMLLDHAGSALAEMDRHDLKNSLAMQAQDASERAWNLRHAFDRIQANAAFEPVLEASMPPGFPKPGPVGRIVTKNYPGYRAARTGGGTAFWTLFSHIKKNDVEMTTPVEMTMDDQMRMRAMAFLYETSTQGSTGRQGSVDVVDLESVQVLSIGMRGSRDAEALAVAKALLEAHMAEAGLERAGDWRVLGYNSPMIASSKRFWELQIPVTR